MESESSKLPLDILGKLQIRITNPFFAFIFRPLRDIDNRMHMNIISSSSTDYTPLLMTIWMIMTKTVLVSSTKLSMVSYGAV